MRSRLRARWYEIEQSLWFLPAVLSLAAALLALVTVQLDHVIQLERQHDVPWLFGGGAEGARGVLQAIAGTMITVTALVFSITVVALQLATSQLSPRLLRTFMADRGNQAVMGFFIATFTYALLVLRAVRAPLEDAGGFVPVISVTVAIGLTLISVGLLIYFVHHAANAMRGTVVIDRAVAATRRLIDAHQRQHESGASREAIAEWQPAAAGLPVVATAGGYVRSIDTGALCAIAGERALTLQLTVRVGDFLLAGEPLALVWSPAGLEVDDGRRINQAVVLDFERTVQDDLAFGVQQISEIAVKALSAGINDPVTAIICIDRLSEVMVALGAAGLTGERQVLVDDGGRVITPEWSFGDLAEVAFRGVRHFGAGDPMVAEHLARSLGRIAALVPATARAPLAHEARLVCAAAREQGHIAADTERIVAAAAWATLPPAAAGSLPDQSAAV